MSADENSAYKSSVPKRYKKIDIKLGKMGVDDFDFDSYNKVIVNFVGTQWRFSDYMLPGRVHDIEIISTVKFLFLADNKELMNQIRILFIMINRFTFYSVLKERYYTSSYFYCKLKIFPVAIFTCFQWPFLFFRQAFADWRPPCQIPTAMQCYKYCILPVSKHPSESVQYMYLWSECQIGTCFVRNAEFELKII